MKLKDQKVLITGGGSGIGLALARLLGPDNRVLLCGRSGERLQKAATELSGDVAVLTCDVTRRADLQMLIAEAERQLGGLSLLINNAAIQRSNRFAEDAPEEICMLVEEEVATNFTGLVQLTALAMPLLLREPEGAVVNIGSGLAISPKKSAPVYCATKAAVHVFTRALRYQMESFAPRVAVMEAMLPLVDTPMTAGRGRGKISAEQAAQQIVAGIRRGRGEVDVGKVKLLKWLRRLAPEIAERLLRDQ